MAREIVWTGFVSVDGLMDSPGGEAEGHPYGGWVSRTPFVPEAFALKGEELLETGALMFGRRSYEAFAPVWRDSEDHAAYRELLKYVVSSTLDASDVVDGWGEITVLRTTDDVAALKNADGDAIFIHGSGALARSLGDAGLIDRYNLLVFPVLLGSGKGVFPSAAASGTSLTLRSSETYSNGVMKAVFDVVR
jgi:dihydrofolate reductase